MIGASAILDDLLLVGLPLLVLIAGVAFLWRSKGAGMPLRAKIAIGLFFSLFLVASFRFMHQFNEHRRLGTLRVDQVAAIDIDGRVYAGEESLSGVIQALNQSQWFTSSHGGWAREVPVTIRLRSNEQLHYRVALYLREHGAVILLFSPRRNGGESRYGYAFSRSLPSAMAAAGSPLPSER
jgi:hypothetical protein